MNLIKSLKNSPILRVFHNKPLLSQASILILSLILTALVMYGNTSPAADTSSSLSAPTSVDTHIPPGYVLIPIDVENYESLDLILGQYGVVNLYKTSENNKNKSQLVVQSIKILRSPLNPQHFAVLSPESQAQDILKYGSQFMVVVQNPKKLGTKFVAPAKKPRLKIIIDH